MARPLDRHCQPALMLRAGCILTPRLDLATLRQVAAQFIGVLIIHFADLLLAEGAGAPTARPAARPATANAPATAAAFATVTAAAALTAVTAAALAARFFSALWSAACFTILGQGYASLS